MTSRRRLVITGGLGSGKSTGIALLEGLGWSVLDADRVGQEILKDPEVVSAIRQKWPAAVSDGSVRRPELAALVFGDQAALRDLEAITHPRIKRQIQAWLETNQGFTAIEVSVPRAIDPQWGIVVVFHAPEEIRLNRAVDRGMKEPDARRRLAAQPGEADALAVADLVIDNSGDLDSLRDAVLRLDEWCRS